MNRLVLFLCNYFGISHQFCQIPNTTMKMAAAILGNSPFEEPSGGDPHLSLSRESILFGGHARELSSSNQILDQPPHVDVGFKIDSTRNLYGLFKPGTIISSLSTNFTRDIYIMEGSTKKSQFQ